MLNLKQLAGGVALSVFLACSLIVAGARADSDSSWLSPNPLYLSKMADVSSVPTNLTGSVDCFMDTNGACTYSVPYGFANSMGAVQSASSSKFYPVYSYLENRPRFLAIPNSNTIITYTTEPVYGLYVYFNYIFTSSAKFIDKSLYQLHMLSPYNQ